MFICASMDVTTQLELFLHEQTQNLIVASVACTVGRQQFYSRIASLPLVFLLFIVIPTLFYLFVVCLLFIIQYRTAFICTET